MMRPAKPITNVPLGSPRKIPMSGLYTPGPLLTITIDPVQTTPHTILTLHDLLMAYPGPTPIRFHFVLQDYEVWTGIARISIQPTLILLQEIKALLGDHAVSLPPPPPL